MTIQDTLALGPVNLPVRYLLFAVSVAVGYGVMSLAVRRHEGARRSASARLANSVVAFVVVWKLEPLASALLIGLLRGSLRFQGLWLNLLLPGGRAAAIAGAAAVLVYLAAAFIADWRAGAAGKGSRSPLRAAFAGPAAFLSALVPAALVYLLAAALLSPHPPAARAADGVVAVPVGIEVGDRAPGFTAETLAGDRVSLAEGAGRTIVLNFWATWCPPCRAELPELVAFAAHHPDSRIAVWAVNMTSSELSVQSVERFARANKIAFPILLDRTGAIAAAYGVRAIPTTYVISQHGIILAKHFGAMSPGWLRDHTAAAVRAPRSLTTKGALRPAPGSNLPGQP